MQGIRMKTETGTMSGAPVNAENETAMPITLCGLILGVIPELHDATSTAMVRRRLLLVLASALLNLVTDEEFAEVKALLTLESQSQLSALESVLEHYRYTHPALVRAAALKLSEWMVGSSAASAQRVQKHLLFISDELRNAIRMESLILASVVTEESCQ
jgi:hypothetical protein